MPTDQAEEAVAQEELVPTSVEGWAKKPVAAVSKEEGFITPLPSGNVVRMRRSLDLVVQLQSGQIPNPLAGIVRKMIDTGNPNFPMDAADSNTMLQFLDLMNETAVHCIISPPFAMPPKRGYGENGRKLPKPETAEEYQARLEKWVCPEGHISVWDMEMEDRLFVFAVAQGAAANLATFREQSERTLAALQAGEGVREPAKRTGGTRPKKKR
jgi:hypothetical protein